MVNIRRNSEALTEPGDRVPELELVRAERVQPGEVVWGIQWRDDLRHGFLLDVKGRVCVEGARFVVGDGRNLVQIGTWELMEPNDLVLVQVHR